MSFEIMLKLAKRITELINRNDLDGIVITHGTEPTCCCLGPVDKHLGPSGAKPVLPPQPKENSKP